MINEITLEKLYKMALNEESLTTKGLLSLGFNSVDLTKLVKDGTLERIQRGIYEFKSDALLFHYGKKLMGEQNYSQGISCFEKSLEMNPNNTGAAYQLFKKAIRECDYRQAFNYFEVCGLYDIDVREYNPKNKLLLYLFSMLIEVPEEYISYVKGISMEDLTIRETDTRYNNIEDENKIRKLVLNGEYIKAMMLIDQLRKDGKSINDVDMMVKNLLFVVNKNNSNRLNHFKQLIENGDYSLVVHELVDIKKKRNLNPFEECILDMTGDLFDIMAAEQLPIVQDVRITTLGDAIKAKNYKLALEMYNDSVVDNGNLTLQDKILKLLLVQLNKEVDFSKEEIDENSEQMLYANIIRAFVDSDLENVFDLLDKYLPLINKENYKFLIVDLAKISILEKDLTFSKPIITLTTVGKDDFSIDTVAYLKDFYQSLANGKLEQAEVYLDIINKAETLDRIGIDVDSLNNVFNNMKVVMSDEPERKLDESDLVIPIGRYEDGNIITPVIDEYPDKTEVDDAVIDENVIKQYMDKINDKGLIILDVNDASYKEVVARGQVYEFFIGEGNNKKRVLRYYPVENWDYLDYKMIMNDASSLYNEGCYVAAIKLYKELFQTPDLNSYIYSKLGLAYAKLWDIETAVDYLSVATELSKKEGKEYNYSDIIAGLRGNIEMPDNEPIKPVVRMKESDFKKDCGVDYTIPNREEIDTLLTQGVSPDIILNSFNFNDEQRGLVKLHMTKTYYGMQIDSLGDRFLGEVERAKGKTPLIKDLYSEVKKNRKFYKYRKND